MIYASYCVGTRIVLGGFLHFQLMNGRYRVCIIFLPCCSWLIITQLILCYLLFHIVTTTMHYCW